MPLLSPLAERLAALAAPWHDRYADSAVLPTAVVFLHLGALLVAGGLALASDRATILAAHGDDAARRRQLEELERAHRLVVPALGVVMVSGFLLFLADVESYAGSPAFWAKGALVVALLANGAVMRGAERRLQGASAEKRRVLWRPLRASAIASVALWLAIVLAGTILTNA